MVQGHANSGDSEMTRSLLSLRRDAAAVTIFNFHLLSGAFRSKNRVPKYLPSSALARKRLFEGVVDSEQEWEQWKGIKFRERGRAGAVDRTAQEAVIITGLESQRSPQVLSRRRSPSFKRSRSVSNDPFTEKPISLNNPAELAKLSAVLNRRLAPEEIVIAEKLARQQSNLPGKQRHVPQSLEPTYSSVRIWREIHELAFSKAFTEITVELDKVIGYSKAILGEERL